VEFVSSDRLILLLFAFRYGVHPQHLHFSGNARARTKERNYRELTDLNSNYVSVYLIFVAVAIVSIFAIKVSTFGLIYLKCTQAAKDGLAPPAPFQKTLNFVLPNASTSAGRQSNLAPRGQDA
jgi:hypothetical protein